MSKKAVSLDKNSSFTKETSSKNRHSRPAHKPYIRLFLK